MSVFEVLPVQDEAFSWELNVSKIQGYNFLSQDILATKHPKQRVGREAYEDLAHTLLATKTLTSSVLAFMTPFTESLDHWKSDTPLPHKIISFEWVN